MTGELDSPPDGAGRWLPVVEAASILDTTERTLRRRAIAGHVRSRQANGRTEVWVAGQASDNAPVTVTEDRPAPESAQNDALLALERLLRDTLREKDAAQQSAAMWQERGRNLEAEVTRLAGQVEELLSLPAHEEPAIPWWKKRWWR